MNMKRTLLASAIVGMFYSVTSMAAGLTDTNDPYVTADEVSATRSMPTRVEERIADRFDPFILNHEIVVTEGCANPASELITDSDNPYVTYAQLDSAEMNKQC